MLNNDITHLTEQHYDMTQYRKSIDRIFGQEEVTERFKNRKMYYQAMKSFCKSDDDSVRQVLEIASKLMI